MALNRKILIAQPPGPARDKLTVLLKENNHHPHVADTTLDALSAVHILSANGQRYDIIFLCGFAPEDMCNLANSIRRVGGHAATDIVGCSENIHMWHTVDKDSYFSFMRLHEGGWNLPTLRNSFFPIMHLA